MKDTTTSCCKWYNVEIAYNTVESIKRANNFKNWLHENDFKFEPSAAGSMVHFEVLMNPEDVAKVNQALDEIVWFDAITEKR